MKSNFEFLQAHYPMLFRLGSLAGTYLYSDPNSCLIKLGMFGETVVNLMLKLDDIPPPDFDSYFDNTASTVSDYDLIIIDEADIGYVLGKQMDDAEIQSFKYSKASTISPI